MKRFLVRLAQEDGGRWGWELRRRHSEDVIASSSKTQPQLWMALTDAREAAMAQIEDEEAVELFVEMVEKVSADE